MSDRIPRFGWVEGIVLSLVALVGIGVAIAVVLARPSAGGGPSTPSPTTANAAVGVSVTGVRILPVDPSHLPAPNHEYVAIAVQLTDTGPTAAAYSVDTFLLRDQAGNTLNPDPGGAYLLGASALPLQGTLQPGARRRGEIVFEVPMSDHTATLVLQPAGSTTGGAASWVLTI